MSYIGPNIDNIIMSGSSNAWYTTASTVELMVLATIMLQKQDCKITFTALTQQMNELATRFIGQSLDDILRELKIEECLSTFGELDQ